MSTHRRELVGRRRATLVLLRRAGRRGAGVLRAREPARSAGRARADAGARVGMTAVILARQIDISIGSQFAICGVVAGCSPAQAGRCRWSRPGRWLAGAALGAVNGALVAVLGLPAIVVTLATMVAWREALRWATEGVWVQDLPAGFQWFGLGQAAGRAASCRRSRCVVFAASRLGAGATSPPAARSTPPAPTPRRRGSPASARAASSSPCSC